MKIGYFGIKGSYSYFASVSYFGEQDFVPYKKFSHVFESVKSGDVECGVIPIENSLAGSVFENYHLLSKFEVKIAGEQYLKIEHCLLGLAGSSEGAIRKVYAHPQALAQCSKFLEEHQHIEQIAFSDNASAAEYVGKIHASSDAALASEATGKMYGLSVLSRDVADTSDNYTRFLIISKNDIVGEEANKCSLVFNVAHAPGSLFNGLRVFAENGLNLTKIESRPLHDQPFEYLFYVDLEFKGKKISEMNDILRDFEKNTRFLKVSGIYKGADLR